MRILEEKEKKEIFERYRTNEAGLPKILLSDPVALELKLRAGDVIEIKRKEPTGECLFYRIASEF
jgi:DNA-directed RNA polymerase subunit H (RpoH/RPB5)